MDYQQMTLFGEQGTKQLRSYQGGSLASRTALQDCVKRLMMNVIYGRSTGELLTKLSQDGLWLKMYAGCCQAKMDGSFEEYSEILPTWGLMLDGAVFELPTSEQFMPENGLRLLPTPTATDYKGGGDSQKKRVSIQLSTALSTLLLSRYGQEDYLSTPCICRKDDGLSKRLVELKGYGNAVVPQQFYPFFKAIYDIETKEA